MPSHEFRQVDVFCKDGFDGNPLAVVHGADALRTEQMQAIAHWTNLSETSFLLRPEDPAADYRVRIFTPFEELPFAGHPTIGSAHAWLEAGGEAQTEGRVVQECHIGLVALRRDDGRLAFESPPLVRSGPVRAEERARILTILGLPETAVRAIEWVDNGPRWIGVELGEDTDITALAPRPVDDEEADIAAFKIAAFRAGSELEDVDVEVRCFFGKDLREDPVTGSANASIARYLYDKKRVRFPYVAAQGRCIGRDGRVYVRADDDGTIWVGGDARTMLRGQLEA